MMFEHALVAVALGSPGDVLTGCADRLKGLGTRGLTPVLLVPAVGERDPGRVL